LRRFTNFAAGRVEKKKPAILRDTEDRANVLAATYTRPILRVAGFSRKQKNPGKDHQSSRL